MSPVSTPASKVSAATFDSVEKSSTIKVPDCSKVNLFLFEVSWSK